jgi:hypothetical protein
VPIGFLIARLPVLGWLSEHVLPRELVAQAWPTSTADPKR